MKGIELLESLQELDEDLLMESGETRRVRHVRRWGALAACAVLLAGGLYLGLGQGGARPVVPGGMDAPIPVGAEPGSGGETAVTVRPIVPGGNGGERGPGSDPMPQPLGWRDVPEMPDLTGQWWMLVGEPLTREQTAACAPSIRLEWMQDFEGGAVYSLADGSGGLAYVELRIARGEGEKRIEYRILLRQEDAPAVSEELPEEGVCSIDGHAYRAYRCRYTAGEEERTALTVRFAWEGLACAISADIPGELELYAGVDMKDLMLCYFGSHVPPDLSGFHYSGDAGEAEIP